MKKKYRLPESGEAIKRETETPAAEIKQGGANSIFPQEYEEQLGEEIRMKRQPFSKPKKRRG